MTEFGEVVREWARRQLVDHSGHAGPFTVRSVRLELPDGHGSPGTPSDDSLEAYIEFDHDQARCPELRYDGAPCPSTLWSTTEATSTVKMLNELLAIADDPGTRRDHD